MAPTKKRKTKRAAKTNQRRRASQAHPGPESADRASNRANAERTRNQLALDATERFLKSGIEVQDVYGNLD